MKYAPRPAAKIPMSGHKEYVNALNRREYEEQKELLISRSPTKLLKRGDLKAFNSGYLFLQSLYCRLGLDTICRDITARHDFSYNLNDILSRQIFTRMLFPASKASSLKQSRRFIKQPSFQLHDIYRALSVLAQENDFIQAALYQNSQKLLQRRKDILYYDCTNYYFELEQEDAFRKYGRSKQQQPLPLVGMGLFIDYDGIPLAFDLFPGNQNEQPTLKPLEQKVLKQYRLERVIVCTDAGLSATMNRKFNDKTLGGQRVRSFITTQSIKQLPEHLKDFALDPDGWHLIGSDRVYNLLDLDPVEDFNQIYYKERWIKEDLSGRQIRQGIKPLEQHLIVSFSLKYRNYQQKIRQGQIQRAQTLIASGRYKQRKKNQNDPHRLIGCHSMTEDGEVATKERAYLDTAVIAEEERYDGFYAVCTNLDDADTPDIISINKKRWKIEECFRIMKTEFKARPVYLQKKTGSVHTS